MLKHHIAFISSVVFELYIVYCGCPKSPNAVINGVSLYDMHLECGPWKPGHMHYI